MPGVHSKPPLLSGIDPCDPIPPTPLTELLGRWSRGDSAPGDALVPLVYDELRRIARRCLVGKGKGHTLQPTALVHEAYLRLAKTGDGSNRWQDRMHFFATAARAMRQILVDHARKHMAAKRGGGAITIVLEDSAAPQKPILDLLALDDALKRLVDLDARPCQIVELRFFGGLSIEEAAQVADVSPATAKRDWATARLWLHQEMGEGHPA
jgi:RNA polymerase sigma-70 factor, ECF subfamily